MLGSVLETARRIRGAFRNWVEVCVIGGIAAPSSLPPRGGLKALAGRRLRFETRLGPVLETDAGNSSPIVEVFAYGEYDLPVEWAGLRRIVDVGAHVGAFSVWAAWQARDARVVAVEPEPRNFRDLATNVERNALGDRVDCVNAAVSAAPGAVELHVPLYRESGSIYATTGATVAATGVSLADLLARAGGPVDLMKLDAEGAEWGLFDASTSEEWEPVASLVLECHATGGRTVEQMLTLLAERGFSPRVLHRAASSVPWYDEVAVIWAVRQSSSS